VGHIEELGAWDMAELAVGQIIRVYATNGQSYLNLIAFLPLVDIFWVWCWGLYIGVSSSRRGAETLLIHPHV
jgi:hypothetical protein